MEPGESVEDAARRELREETGLEVGALRLHRVLSGAGAHHRYPNGDEVWNVTVAFVGREPTGRLAVDGREVVAARWWGLQGLPPDLSPPIAELVRSFAAAQPPSAACGAEDPRP